MAKKKKSEKTENKQAVVDGDAITINYKCTLEDGTVTGDSFETGESLSFEVGAKTVLSGIDVNVVGMSVGDTKSFSIEAEEAYGAYDETRMGTLPPENFPENFLPQLEEGMVVPLQSKDGSHRLIATVKEVTSDGVQVDFNHPLAGQTLNFDIEVLSIGDSASATEGSENA
jgi:FKBP-type peptidyl-prolyl cis-trans isomerase 2